MVKVVEFRIPLPLKTSEFKTALPYVVTRCSEELTLAGTGDRVKVLVNEPFNDGKIKGQYTHKVFLVSERLPSWVKSLIPVLKDCTIEEKSWNAFPYCKSVYECKLLGERFKMEVLSMHFDDDKGDRENALDISSDKLALRQVRKIDIRDVDHLQGIPLPSEFVPTKASERGPLDADWMEGKKSPVMCAYKVVSLEVSIWPIQEQCESYMLRTQVVQGITEVCTRSWCWLDSYVDMDEKDLRKYQDESNQRLERFYKTGEKPADYEGKSSATNRKQLDEQEAKLKQITDDGKPAAIVKGGVGEEEEDDGETPVCRVIPEIKMPTIRIPALKMPTIPSEPLQRIMTALNLAPERVETTPIDLPSQIPPQWVPDNKAASCAGCRADFGLLLRKHHCRGCGKVMCHNCTQKSRVLSQYRDYYGPSPQRVCERCDKRQTELENNAKRKRARHNRSISAEGKIELLLGSRSTASSYS